jgi:hypothetical protein
MIRVVSFVSAFLFLYWAAPSTGQPVSNKVAPSGITEENYKKIEASKGKWSQGDVIGLLGRPDRFRIVGNGILEMVWEDVNRVSVEFIKGKAEFLWGQFSEKLPAKTVTLENFKKLRSGMTVEDVKNIMGAKFDKYQGAMYVRGIAPFDDLTVRDGATLYVWQKLRCIRVQFQDGKVSGYTWTQWFEAD